MTAKRSRKPQTLLASPADAQEHADRLYWPPPATDIAQARRFIELLAGADSVECFHALKRDSTPTHVHGAIDDPAIAAKLMDWNLNGFDLYMTAHLLKNGVRGWPTNEDVAEGRAGFIDSDGKPRPDRWHIPPDFIIEREDDPACSWWAWWLIEPFFPADQIERCQLRLAAQYGTDRTVSDARRIVRLPGFVRWKANETPGKSNAAKADTIYRLLEGSIQ